MQNYNSLKGVGSQLVQKCLPETVNTPPPPLCVAMKSLGKIFAQWPLWMSEITSELELDPLGLKTAAELTLSPPLIYSFFQLFAWAFLSSPPTMANRLLLACIEPIPACASVHQM